LERDPIFDGTQVVADVQLTGRLNAAEDAWHQANLSAHREPINAAW
jgi:hypothetical protein